MRASVTKRGETIYAVGSQSNSGTASWVPGPSDLLGAGQLGAEALWSEPTAGSARGSLSDRRDYPRLSPLAKLPWSPSCKIVHSGSTQESHPNSSPDPCFVIMSLKRTNFLSHGTYTPTRIPLVIMSTGLNVLAQNRRNWQVNFIDSGLKFAKTRFQRFLRGKSVFFQIEMSNSRISRTWNGARRNSYKVLWVTKRANAFETNAKR